MVPGLNREVRVWLHRGLGYEPCFEVRPLMSREPVYVSVSSFVTAVLSGGSLQVHMKDGQSEIRLVERV